MNKQIKVAALAASLVTMAGMAHAATVDVNIYGASAQYLYWNDVADNFMTSRGCTGITQAGDGKNGITTGTCGADTVNIRYSAKASLDGIKAVKSIASSDCSTGNNRKLRTNAASTATSCQQVHIGASDVAGESFTQESHGVTFGPRGDNTTTADNDIALTPEDTTGLSSAQPLAVPFGFFVNKKVTQNTCSSGANAGNYCQDDSDCGGTLGATTICNGSTTKTIDNLSRLQAVNIFAGNVTDWSNFGKYYTAQPVVTCLRHAGSGTHATLDKAVMSGNGWGGTLTAWESVGAPHNTDPAIWFNEGSTDEIKCVNGNYKIGSAAEVTGSLIGAIGYADADQATGVANTSQNVVAIKYNGYNGTRYNVRNGAYDFFSKQWLYWNPSDLSTSQKTLVEALAAYAADPANVPATKAKYWATADEMNFAKDTDTTYPYLSGASNPQEP